MSTGMLRTGPLAHADYRYLVSGATVSALGNAITPVALAFGVLDLGGSATDLGLVVSAFAAAEVLTVLAVDGVDEQTLSAVPLDGAGPRTLMRMTDLGSYGVGRFQLASSAAGSLEVVDPDDVDRGPWPWALRVLLAAVAGLLSWAVARRLLRGRVRTR
jgi:hypothetical protein